MTTTTTPAPGRAAPVPAPQPAPGADPLAETVLIAHTADDVPAELPTGLVVVLPGGFRMRSGRAPAPAPRPPAPVPDVAPPEVVPPDGPTRARAAGLTRLVTEVLAGRRAPAQLGGLATPGVLRYLAAARTGAALRPALATTAGRGGRAGAPGCGAPAAARAARVHVARPHPDAAEVCATVPLAGRPRALALRLDRTTGDSPWIVTAVRLL